jgi:hypothetical protein
MNIIKVIIITILVAATTQTQLYRVKDNHIQYRPLGWTGSAKTISVIGPARVGKSTLMNGLSRYLGNYDNNFKTSDGIQSCTKGINYHVVQNYMLLDMEGDDLDNEVVTTKLATVLSSISSHIIYYTNMKLNNAAVQKIQFLYRAMKQIKGGNPIPMTVLLRSNLNIRESATSYVKGRLGKLNRVFQISAIQFAGRFTQWNRLLIGESQDLNTLDRYMSHITPIVNQKLTIPSYNIFEEMNMKECLEIYRSCGKTEQSIRKTITKLKNCKIESYKSLYTSKLKEKLKHLNRVKKMKSENNRLQQQINNRDELDDVLKVIGVLAPLFLLSDETLKWDIRSLPIHTEPQLVSWKWNPWLTEMPKYNMGVIAQEVLMYCTNCVIKTDVLMVNYTRVLPMIKVV